MKIIKKPMYNFSDIKQVKDNSELCKQLVDKFGIYRIYQCYINSDEETKELFYKHLSKEYKTIMDDYENRIHVGANITNEDLRDISDVIEKFFDEVLAKWNLEK